MVVKPLDPAQQAAVHALADSHRIETVPVDTQRATIFMAKAQHRLTDVDNLTWAEGRYNYAYDAAHDVGEALLSAYGYRTVNGPGQHEALGRFLRAVLTTVPGQEGAQRFEQMRRARNLQRYEARPVSSSEAHSAVKASRDIFAGALGRGLIVE